MEKGNRNKEFIYMNCLLRIVFLPCFFTDFFVIPARSYLPSQPLISTAAAFLNPAVAKRCEFKGQIFDPWKYPGVCALFKIICGEL